MPLNRQISAVPFVGGLQQKRDPFQIDMGKLAVLANGVFTTTNEIKCRPGYTALTTTILNPILGSTVTTGNALMNLNNELVLADTNYLYSFDDSVQGWVYKAPFHSVYTTLSSIVKNSYTQSAADGNVSSGGQMFAWQDSRGGVWYSIVATDGQVTVPGTQIGGYTDAIQPKVIAFDGYWCLFFVRTSTARLYMAYLSTNTPYAAPTIDAITSASSGDQQQLASAGVAYDATVVATAGGSQMWVTYAAKYAGVATLLFTTPTSSTLYVSSIAGKDILPLGVWADTITSTVPNNAVMIGYENVTDDLLGLVCFDYTGSNTVTATTVLTLSGNTPASMNGISVGTSTRNVEIVIGADGGNTFTPSTPATLCSTYISVVTGPNNAIVVSSPSLLMNSVSPFAKPFLYHPTPASSIVGIPMAYQSIFPTAPGINGLQNQYFVVDNGGNILARFLYGLGGGLAQSNNAYNPDIFPLIAESPTLDGVNFMLTVLQTDLLSTLSGQTPAPGNAGATSATYTQTGVSSVNLDFNNAANSYLRAQLGGTLLVGGGFLQMYDGQSVVENGFFVTPEPVLSPVPVQATTGGHIAPGTYWYSFCWEWTDSTGMTHRSTPSVPIPITVPAGTSTNTVTFTFPSLSVSGKNNTQSPVILMAYRSTDLLGVPSQVFYQCINTIIPAVSGSAANTPVINDPSATTISFVDYLADASIQGNVQLYTAGSVLEDAPPPNGVSALAVNHSRVFALDSMNPLVVYYSKQCIPGYTPVEMSQYLSLNIDSRGGPVTAIAALDANLVVFKESSIFLVVGTGPDNTGNQNDFQDPLLITSDAGCINPRSIALIASGLVFQSAKGIYHLDRGLQVTYIGADVETTANSTFISSTQLLATTNQVRFTFANEPGLLMYDYYVQQWGIHYPPGTITDSTIFQGTYTYLTNDGVVYQENDTYLDGTTFISMIITTPWLQFAGLNGFERIYQLELLGQLLYEHNVTVQIAYDFQGGVQQTITIPPTSNTALYLNQARIFPNRQKCTAMQFTFTTTQGGSESSQAIFKALSYVVGVKGTLRKPPTGGSFGG